MKPESGNVGVPKEEEEEEYKGIQRNTKEGQAAADLLVLSRLHVTTGNYLQGRETGQRRRRRRKMAGKKRSKRRT